MFLFIDKPKGRSSFDCVRKLQRYYGKKIYYRKVKIGHAGTLDPMATGLMLIAIGKSTKQLCRLTGLDKTYTATIDLSQMSDTWDDEAWGRRARRNQESGKWNQESRNQKVSKRIEHEDLIPFVSVDDQLPQEFESIAKKRGYDIQSSTRSIPTEEEIKNILASFVDREAFLLTPFSAKKIDGNKLYEYARKGTPILRQSPMDLISCELLEYTFPHVKVRFHVGSGTYIRSLGFELGKTLGWGGVLVELRREKIGEWSV